MDHDVALVLGTLAIILLAARLFRRRARAIGQPAVLGELLAGVALGASVLGLIHPENHDTATHILHFLAELGVVVLLFEIGLETDLAQLLGTGSTSMMVAFAGVVLPFAGGYLVCHWFGQDNRECIMAGGATTATSVGITARVLNDLGRLQAPESQIVLGAAVIDDILGLIILTVVEGMSPGHELTAAGIAIITAKAFGFLIAALLVGSLIIPPLVHWLHRKATPGMLTTVALFLALGLAWAADRAGSAVIIGAFAAGLLLRRTPQVHEFEKAILPLAYFLVPVFFVFTGAAVDVRTFVPHDAAGWTTLAIGGSLIVVAVLGKVAAGYAPFWYRGRKLVIGVGMVPRGEVGLIFAQVGLSTKVFDHAMFSAVLLMVVVTTFLAPPLLRALMPPADASDAKERDAEDEDTIEEVIS